MSQHSTLVWGQSPAPPGDGYTAARERAAFFDRSERGRLLVTGRDRAAYLHGLLTNDIAGLQTGEGTYAAYLTPQGRMISDMWIYELGDAMLMVLPRQSQAAVYEKLDQFVFSEDVQLSDATAAFAAVAVVGPEAAATTSRAAAIDRTLLDRLPEHGCARVIVDTQPAIVTRITDAGEPGFELYVSAPAATVLHERLLQAGAARLDAAGAETLRIEGGIPLFHRDMDENTIPLEAGIESRAISMTKGCYVGQEVIVRVMHRGHGRVARRLVGLVIDASEVPAPGAPVTAAGKEAGTVTSCAMSPWLHRPIALAYVHRDLAEPGTAVQVAGTPAHVHGLPFKTATAPTESSNGG